MSVSDQIREATGPLLSVEFFPPRTDAARGRFHHAAHELVELRPDFVSVTCGAGGSAPTPTLEICELLRGAGFETVMPHCTCAGRSRAELGEQVDEWVRRGFENVMALRGDPPAGTGSFTVEPGGFRYAAELIAFLRERHPRLGIGAGGYPEVHPESRSQEEDILYLKAKVDAGTDFIITQLFLENGAYFRFVERCREVGIEVPVIPGILPVLSLEQMDRMRAFCSFSIPDRLLRHLEEVRGDPRKAERVGIYWAIDQIAELVEGGAPGIHLYLLNRVQTAFYPELFACLGRIRHGGSGAEKPPGR